MALFQNINFSPYCDSFVFAVLLPKNWQRVFDMYHFQAEVFCKVHCDRPFRKPLELYFCFIVVWVCFVQSDTIYHGHPSLPRFSILGLFSDGSFADNLFIPGY